MLLQDIATGLCLQDFPAGTVYTTGCNGNVYQTWSSWNDGHNNYHFLNIGSQQCLQSDFSHEVYTRGCIEIGFQYWSFWSTGHNDYHYLNNKTQECLDSNGDSYTLPCNEGDFQKWRNLGG